jgi:hypothetical protein
MASIYRPVMALVENSMDAEVTRMEQAFRSAYGEGKDP